MEFPKYPRSALRKSESTTTRFSRNWDSTRPKSMACVRVALFLNLRSVQRSRMANCSPRRIASTRLPTKWGPFEAIGYAQDLANANGQTNSALALILGDINAVNAPLLRIHAQCFTGEMLGSLRCDCGEQLEVAMQTIAAEGCGLV